MLIEFIAATPCSGGVRPSPAMTKFEKPKNTPPTKAAPNAAAKLVPMTRLSGILFLQHLGRLQAIGDAIKVHRCGTAARSEEHTSELQSLMRISYAVFCLKKK